MWISVQYHANSAPNQWITECGMQNVHCSPLLLPSDAQCPLNCTRSLPGPFHQITAAEVASCNHVPTPWPMGHTGHHTHWFLLAVPLSILQCPMSSATVTSPEWPLWLAAAAHTSLPPTCVTACVALHSTGGCWLHSATAYYRSVTAQSPVTGTMKVRIQSLFSVGNSLCKKNDKLIHCTASTNVELR